MFSTVVMVVIINTQEEALLVHLDLLGMVGRATQERLDLMLTADQMDMLTWEGPGHTMEALLMTQ